MGTPMTRASISHRPASPKSMEQLPGSKSQASADRSQSPQALDKPETRPGPKPTQSPTGRRGSKPQATAKPQAWAEFFCFASELSLFFSVFFLFFFCPPARQSRNKTEKLGPPKQKTSRKTKQKKTEKVSPADQKTNRKTQQKKNRKTEPARAENKQKN